MNHEICVESSAAGEEGRWVGVRSVGMGRVDGWVVELSTTVPNHQVVALTPAEAREVAELLLSAARRAELGLQMNEPIPS